ncbi:hypothetical protein HDU93_008123 [Gonapodya sp. JEL0774]|nr:hypothetical protein HDU93_008123 [Gonapodya sp. JEL0774]
MSLFLQPIHAESAQNSSIPALLPPAPPSISLVGRYILRNEHAANSGDAAYTGSSRSHQSVSLVGRYILRNEHKANSGDAAYTIERMGEVVSRLGARAVVALPEGWIAPANASARELPYISYVVDPPQAIAPSSASGGKPVCPSGMDSRCGEEWKSDNACRICLFGIGPRSACIGNQ